MSCLFLLSALLLITACAASQPDYRLIGYGCEGDPLGKPSFAMAEDDFPVGGCAIIVSRPAK